ncbi:MAG: hypothetical protein IPL43_04125 [Micropruina sp.]|nr:hypothetical protein [Micropruina sp.]
MFKFTRLALFAGVDVPITTDLVMVSGPWPRSSTARTPTSTRSWAPWIS